MMATLDLGIGWIWEVQFHAIFVTLGSLVSMLEKEKEKIILYETVQMTLSRMDLPQIDPTNDGNTSHGYGLYMASQISCYLCYAWQSGVNVGTGKGENNPVRNRTNDPFEDGLA